MLRCCERPSLIFVTGLLAALSPGCVIGAVRDADVDAGVAATVSAYAQCTGSGCTVAGTGWQNTTAMLPDGLFNFDAYSATNKAQLSPPLGEEAMELRISMAGFQTRRLFHRPSYVQDKDGRQASIVPGPIWLCRNGAPDTDGDTICDAAELRYGTSPDCDDTDHDALRDDYELFGGRVEGTQQRNNRNLDLASYGANPRRRDVFVEVDYYQGQVQGQAVNNVFHAEAVERVRSAFAQAPIDNPDGSHGIALHIVVDDAIDPAQYDSDGFFNPYGDFVPLKNVFFDPGRAPAFHYAVFAYANLLPDSYGTSPFIPANDFVLTMDDNGDDPRFQAFGFMHELGHNLGLDHGGRLDPRPYKPNYFSIMSYLYNWTGVPTGIAELIEDGGVTDFRGKLDYSTIAVAELREQQLNEHAAMALAGGGEGNLADYRVRVCTNQNALGTCQRDNAGMYQPFLHGNASQDLDFDRDGGIAPAMVSADLNGNRNKTDVFPASTTDWDKLVYSGNGQIGRPGGTSTCGEDAGVAAVAATAAQRTSSAWITCAGPFSRP